MRGLGLANGNVGYGPPRNPSDAWEMRQVWAAAIDFDPESIIGLRQIHGSKVIEVHTSDRGRGAIPGSESMGAADALITRVPDVTLMTLHADCLPILLVDPDTAAVAAVHAGWRGTVEDVAGATVHALESTFGSDPSTLVAFLGPAIGPCCYEVGEEVIESWRLQAADSANDSLAETNGSLCLDLRRANQFLLTRAGVGVENIEISEICTKCDNDHWFSHRGQGADTGRFAAFIALSGESE